MSLSPDFYLNIGVDESSTQSLFKGSQRLGGFVWDRTLDGDGVVEIRLHRICRERDKFVYNIRLKVEKYLLGKNCFKILQSFQINLCVPNFDRQC